MNIAELQKQLIALLDYNYSYSSMDSDEYDKISNAIVHLSIYINPDVIL